MLCVLGGVTGLVIATIAAIVVADATSAPVVVDYRVWGMGVLAIVALSIAVGLLPALKARRLSIVDALAR
jgi:putative ABC transport system permease protein